MIAKRALVSCIAAVTMSAAAAVASAASLVIVNFNGPGVGFNDPTPATPVGGNPGTTLGQQRLNAFAFAASAWGAELQSASTIFIGALMTPLPCTANSAVLGSAGPTFVELGFPGALDPNVLYPVALANKLAGQDLEPGNAHIIAQFSSTIGGANCLTGSPFYLGLDGNHGTAIDLVTVLLHEFGHGLGFLTITDGASGEEFFGFPSVFDKFALDNTTGKTWIQMTDAERVASALNVRNLVWNGAGVTAAAPSVLVKGTPRMTISDPGSIAGVYPVGTASFGPSLADGKVQQKIGQVVDQPNGTGLACTPLSDDNVRAVHSRIALVDRGVCGFAVKAKNVQDAGAKAMIVVDNVGGSPPADMSGADPTITIPSVRVTLDTGNAMKAAMRDDPSGRNSGIHVLLDVDAKQLAGADTKGHVMLFTPNPYQDGSSVSHWDTSAFRNLLMEPAINADLTHSVKPPQDLTLPMLKDMGW